MILNAGKRRVGEESARLLLSENRRHILWTRQLALVDEQNHVCRTNYHREHKKQRPPSYAANERGLSISSTARADCRSFSDGALLQYPVAKSGEYRTVAFFRGKAQVVALIAIDCVANRHQSPIPQLVLDQNLRNQRCAEATQRSLDDGRVLRKTRTRKRL